MAGISGYIPSFNNEATIAGAIDSLRNQSEPVDDLFVVDDGSTDNSAAIAESKGIRVVRLGSNLGRGAARARATEEAIHELIVCLDANKQLESDFVARARKHLESNDVAAAFGRIVQPVAPGVVERWCGRHLYKMHVEHELSHLASLITAGALVRKSAVLEAGNYKSALRHSEDKDLGERLLSHGYKVVFDPDLLVTCQATGNWVEALERYRRWHVGADEKDSLAGYGKLVSYSARVMAVDDVRAGDFLAVPMSLICPHYQFWQSLLHKENRPR